MRDLRQRVTRRVHHASILGRLLNFNFNVSNGNKTFIWDQNVRMDKSVPHPHDLGMSTFIRSAVVRF